MSSFDAGRITATADLDRTPFQQGLRLLKNEARDFEDKRITAKATLNTKDADAQIIAFRSRMEQLAAKKVSPELVLKDVEAKLRLSKFEDRLDALRGKVATARVDVDDAKAKAKLDALDIQLRRVGLVASRPRVSLDGVERANLQLDSLELRLRAVGASGGGGRGGLLSRFAGAHIPNPSGLALGIGAALPLAGPLAGVALGGAASFLTPSLAGAVGLAGFGAAAKSSVTTITGDISKLGKLTAQYDAATTNKQRAAVLTKEAALWKALDPAQRQAVKNVQGLDKAWASYKKRLEPQSFGAVAGGAKIANTGLNLLFPSAQAAGNTIISLERQAEKALQSPFFKTFFGTFLSRETAHAVDTLGVTFGHLGDGFAHLAVAFAPLGHDLERGMVNLSAQFDKWTQGSGPAKFVAWVQREAPIVGKDLEALGSAIGGLIKGLAPIGQLELAALSPILSFIGDLGKQHPEVITVLGGALLTLGAGLKVLNLAQGGVRLGQSINNLGALGKSALGAAGAIGVFGTGYAGGRAGAGAGVSTLGGAITGMTIGLAVGGPWGAAIGAAAGALAGLAGNFLGAAGAADRANKAMQGWMTTAYQADQFKIGEQFNQGIVTSLQSSPKTTAIFATAGVSETQIAGSVRAQNAIGGPAGLQLQAALRAGKISQQEYQAGVKALQTLVDNFGSVVGNLDDIAKITGAVSQHTQDLVSQANAVLKLMYAQPTHNAPAPKTPTLASLLGAAIPTPRAHRAGGGPVLAGVPYTVGELGQELFIPNANGTILPHAQTAAIAKGGVTPNAFRNLGVALAQGFVVGFTGSSGSVLKAFTSSTDKVLMTLGTQMTAEVGKYQSDIASRLSFRQSLQSSLAGAGDIAGATVFGGNSGPRGGVRGYLTAQAGGLRTLAVSLGKLAKLGLSPVLLSQIANAGPQQGVLLAQEILSGTDGSIRSLNRLEGSIQTYANTAAGTVSNAQFSRTLAHDLASIATLAKSVEHLAAKSGRWNTADMHTLASVLAQELSRILKIPLSDIDKALGIRSWTGS